MLPPRTRSWPWIEAVNKYTVLPKSPALLEPQHQIVWCHVFFFVGGVISLGKDAVDVFCSPSRVDRSVYDYYCKTVEIFLHNRYFSANCMRYWTHKLLVLTPVLEKENSSIKPIKIDLVSHGARLEGLGKYILRWPRWNITVN